MPKNKQNSKGPKAQKNQQKQQKGTGSLKQGTAPAAVGADGSCDMSWTPVKNEAGEDGGIAEGQEYVGVVTVPEDEEVGSNNTEMFIAPGEFGGTRLSLKAQEYQKFKFLELEFVYVPAVGSDDAGSLVFSYDRDISNPTPPPSDQGLRQYMSFKDAKYGNVWMSHRTRCPLRGGVKDMLWTSPEIGGDDRLAYQGQFYVATMVPTGLDAGTVLGTIIMKYRCQFAVQALNGELEGAEISASAAIANGSSDAFGKIAGNTPTVDGDPQYLPKLQGDGTYAVTLQEGLFRLCQFLFTPTVTGSGLASFSTPTLQLLEPASASSPQPVIDGITNSSGSLASSVQYPVSDVYLSIPRGGALLRSVVNLSSSLAGTMGIGMSLLKLGGYVASVSGLLTLSRKKREAVQRRAIEAGALVLAQDERAVQSVTDRVLVEGKPRIKPARKAERQQEMSWDCPRCGICERFTPALASVILVRHMSCKSKVSMAQNLPISAALERCRFCGDERPDHLGRDCPVRLKALSTLNRASATVSTTDTNGGRLGAP